MQKKIIIKIHGAAWQPQDLALFFSERSQKIKFSGEGWRSRQWRRPSLAPSASAKCLKWDLRGALNAAARSVRRLPGPRANLPADANALLKVSPSPGTSWRSCLPPPSLLRPLASERLSVLRCSCFFVVLVFVSQLTCFGYAARSERKCQRPQAAGRNRGSVC